MPGKIEMLGRKYGSLLVIADAGLYQKGAAEYQWRCRCECGEEAVVRGACLRSGRTKSCGCLQRRVTAKRNRDTTPTNKLAPGQAAMNAVIRNTRNNAKARHLFWDLSAEQCYDLLQQSCVYCGVAPQQVKQGVRSSPCRYNGLDRLDNSEGYHLWNVVPCCGTCNHAKATMGLGQWRDWVHRLTAHFHETKAWTVGGLALIDDHNEQAPLVQANSRLPSVESSNS